MPCFRTCSAYRRVSSQPSGEPCDSRPMPARGGAQESGADGNERSAKPAPRGERCGAVRCGALRCGVCCAVRCGAHCSVPLHSAEQCHRDGHSAEPGSPLTWAPRQAVTQHFPPAGPAPRRRRPLKRPLAAGRPCARAGSGGLGRPRGVRFSAPGAARDSRSWEGKKRLWERQRQRERCSVSLCEPAPLPRGRNAALQSGQEAAPCCC